MVAVLAALCATAGCESDPPRYEQMSPERTARARASYICGNQSSVAPPPTVPMGSVSGTYAAGALGILAADRLSQQNFDACMRAFGYNRVR